MNTIEFELLLYDYFNPIFDDSDDVICEVLEMFNDNPDKFHSFVEGLLHMIDVGTSPITGKRYKGFSDKGMFLAKVEIEQAKEQGQ